MNDYSSHNNRVNLLGSCFLILLLASLFCLEFTQISWAKPLPVSSSLLISQQSGDNVPTVILEAVRQDLARRYKIAPNQLKLVQSSRQTWPDGCLGLAKPDEICTQALIEGWRVTISHQQRTWVYRTDGQGRILRLEPRK